MANTKAKLWDLANTILEKCDEFVEGQIETVYGTLSQWLQGQVTRTTTKFDDTALRIVEIGIRDKLVEKYPFDKYPLD